MRTTFWARALLPHLALAAALTTLCALFGSPESLVWLVPMLTAIELGVWYWTDLLLTDRAPGAHMIRETEPYTGSDGTTQKETEAATWVVLGITFSAVNVFLVSSGGRGAGVMFLAADLPLLLYTLHKSDTFSAFRTHVWPKICDNSRNAAVTFVTRYYEQHQPITGMLLTAELFQAQVQAEMHDDVPAEKAWGAARDLIAQFAPAVHEETQRQKAARKKERERQRRLYRLAIRIAELEKNIAARNATRDTDDALVATELEDQLNQLRDEQMQLNETP